MKYLGYTARIEYDPADRIFVGRVIGTRDGINFHGASVEELERAFHEAVDDYLAACKELGQEPNKPYSGKLLLRLQPEDHAAIVSAAESSGTSINQWAADVLRRASNDQ